MNPDSLFQQAQSLHQNKQLEQAKESYLSLIKQFPEHAEAHQYLGILLSQMGEHETAIKHLSRAVTLTPTNPIYLVNLAGALARNQQTPQAINKLKHAIGLAPQQVELYYKLAKLYHAQGEYVLAIDYYHETIRLQPAHPQAMYQLAKVYMEHRQFKPAMEYLSLFLHANPSHMRAYEELTIAKSLLTQEDAILAQRPQYQTMQRTYPDFEERAVIHSYLELLKKNLTDTLHLEEDSPDFQRRAEGLTWPLYAETMIGKKRLDNVHYCVSQALKHNIPGDFIETGVWRGGACILMRAILSAYEVNDRKVWVADSFEGLPPPNPEKYPQDAGSSFHREESLKIPLEKVKANFEKYDLLDEQVCFLRGFFSDTLPEAPIEQLAVLRLDGDMYESTMDALVNLYPKLSKGGYIIIDDYGVILPCQRAVEDYRKQQGITTPLLSIDHSGVYWRKENV